MLWRNKVMLSCSPRICRVGLHAGLRSSLQRRSRRGTRVPESIFERSLSQQLPCIIILVFPVALDHRAIYNPHRKLTRSAPMLKRKGLMAKLLARWSFCGLCLLLALPFVLRAQQEGTEPSTAPDALPAEARYLILFRRLAGSPSQNQTSEQSEPRVARPNYRVMFQRNAHLSDEEARALNQIADDCMQKVTELDKRAREIIAAHRAENRTRNGAPGDSPPAELSQLQQDRNNVILSAVEQ